MLGTLLVAAALLAASRYGRMEVVNANAAAELGWPLASWTVEVTVPLVLAAGLLLAWPSRRPAAAVGYGLMAGAALGVVGEMIAWKAILGEEDYAVGPGWWTLLAGVVVLIGGVGYACSAPWLRTKVRLRRDVVAVGAVLLVGAALLIWVLAVGPPDLPPGEWLFYKGQGVLFTLACLPVTVFRLERLQRLVVLAALTTAAAGQVAGGVEILVHSTSGFDMGAVVRALVAVLTALAACYAAQLIPAVRRTVRTAGVS